MPNVKEKNVFDRKPLTKEEIQEAMMARINRINEEFKACFEFIKNYPRSVSIYGSARLDENSEHCQKARQLAAQIAKELNYTIFTGGGNGIMAAANRGAYEAGGQSVGINIKLPKEQQQNQYMTDSLEAYYFFIRKFALSFAAEAYIFFPGGFGTLDEFFEILTLVQTKKIPPVPIILVGRDYWEPLDNFILNYMYKIHGAINKEDMNLYTITDDENKIIEIIRKTPVRNGIRIA